MEKNIKKGDNCRSKISYEYLKKLRIFFVFYIMIEEIIYWYIYPFHQGIQIKFFQIKEWNHFLSLIFYLTLIIKKFDKNRTEKFSLLFHILASVQMATISLYWLIIHKNAKKDAHNFLQLFLLISKHSSPLIFILIDFCFNNIVLSISNVIYVLQYTLFYGIYNFVIVVFFGIEIYKAVTYRDIKSYLIILIIALVSWLYSLLFLKIQKFKYGYDLKNK